eukprot:5043305-Pyramimonas_sp.AAC.1
MPVLDIQQSRSRYILPGSSSRTHASTTRPLDPPVVACPPDQRVNDCSRRSLPSPRLRCLSLP